MFTGNRKPSRVAVFISGGGSTLQALLEMHHQIEIGLVVTNRKNAAGVLKAKRFGKKVFLQNKIMSFSDLHQTLKEHRIEKIILAGYMKILPKEFVDLWQGRSMNIHPSLLPTYPGLESAERSWQDQQNMGVSLHYVNPEMDAGDLFFQQTSSHASEKLDLNESLLLLRRTEQHLLRELALRWN